MTTRPSTGTVAFVYSTWTIRWKTSTSLVYCKSTSANLSSPFFSSSS